MNPTTRKLVIALSVSLALNLFFAGFLVARATFGRRGVHGPHDMRGPFALMMGEGGASGADDRMRKVMRRHREALRAERQGLRDARREAAEALTADPFERTRFEQALAKTRAHTAASQLAMHQALVDLANDLEPEQRRRLARRSLRRGPHPAHGRGAPE